MHPKSSAVDEKQRSPLLEFYLSALAFAGALVLMEYLPSPWREILRLAMIAIAGFAVWALLRFLRVARRTPVANQFPSFALRLCCWFGSLPLLGLCSRVWRSSLFPGLVSSPKSKRTLMSGSSACSRQTILLGSLMVATV